MRRYLLRSCHGLDDGRFILRSSRSSGAIAITRVAQVSGNVWRISFANQITPGVYTLSVLPTIRDAAGNYLNQDRDTISGEPVQDRYTSTITLSAPTTRNYAAEGPVALADATSTRVGTKTSQSPLATRLPSAI